MTYPKNVTLGGWVHLAKPVVGTTNNALLLFVSLF